MNYNFRYVLITAARNEEQFIANTIKSVINQTILPIRWVIIDDNSTDNMWQIISDFAKKYEFIQVFKALNKENRNFASKVFAIQQGENYLYNIDYDFIGILDADVTFENDYYESIAKKFKQNKKLGIAGGVFFDIYNGKKFKIYSGNISVRGAIQLFRKECYEDIGGLLPIRFGGEDGVACISARMHGWDVKSFEDLIVLHHRRTGTSETNIMKARFIEGKREYHLGYTPIFNLLKCFSRISRKPFLLGSISRFFGYWSSVIQQEKRIISREFHTYHKKEQKKRMKQLFLNKKEKKDDNAT